ncbi:E3 ubiquitin-protein ligase TRIM31-like isoform X1 [Diadema antillarum]|uniref:E3 ubiquitin-protein ligase TRIM31-like isoform X1 n=1 Tax=Diadema antillarum TaxID=105358 RepID=UPI003A87FBF3
MATKDGAMEHHLECPICMDIFDDPRCLSCSHTFCASCIDDLVDGGTTVRCPECRQETIIDVTRGAAALNPNSIVNRMAETLKNKNSKVDDSVCDKHQPNLKKYFCMKCEEFICSECTMENHQEHSSQVRLAKTVALEIAETMRQMFEKSETSLGIKERVMNACDEECKRGIAIFEPSALIALERLNDLFASLKSRKNTFNEQLQEMIAFEREQVAQCNDMTQLGKEILDTGTDEDIITTFEQWSNAMSKINFSTNFKLPAIVQEGVKGISDTAQECLDHLRQLEVILSELASQPNFDTMAPSLQIGDHGNEDVLGSHSDADQSDASSRPQAASHSSPSATDSSSPFRRRSSFFSSLFRWGHPTSSGDPPSLTSPSSSSTTSSSFSPPPPPIASSSSSPPPPPPSPPPPTAAAAVQTSRSMSYPSPDASSTKRNPQSRAQ